MAFDFSSFKVIEYQPNQFAHEASAIIHLDKIVFNATSFNELGSPGYIRYWFDQDGKRFAVQAVKKQAKDTVTLLSDRKSKTFGMYGLELIGYIRGLMTDWSDEKRYKVKGEYYPEDGVMVYDLNTAMGYIGASYANRGK